MRNLKALVFISVLLVFWGAVYAQFAGGSGTEADPWQVATAGQLNNVRNYLGETHSDKYFIQTADIDLGVAPWNEGEGWVPIGNYLNKFSGHYNGDGHIVSNLYINRPSSDYQSLFGYINGSVENLGLESVNVTGKNCTGGLAGRSDSGNIINCYSMGSVSGYSYVSGLLGYYYGSGVISNCYSAGTVNGQRDAIGGLVGWDHSGTISNCYSMSTVAGSFNVGGLVGVSGTSIISNCYSTGSVSGNTSTGGLVGNVVDFINIRECYWDIQTSGQTSSAGGGIGRTTQEMTYPYADNTYAFWNWSIWKPDTDQSVNSGYPYLRPLGELPTQAPGPAIHSLPADSSTSVVTTTLLRWGVDSNQTVNSFPQGYRLYLGTNNPPSNIKNGLDLGNTTSYDPNPDLNFNTVYYWKIVPYNQIGEASNCPVWSFTTYIFAQGSGTASDPWQISTAEQLNNVRNYLGSVYNNKYFLQTADIDLGVVPWNEGEGWVPIGNYSDRFFGHYNGGGHTISNLIINRPNVNYQGLFGCISGSVESLRMEYLFVTGKYHVGGLVGYVSPGTVSNCYSMGNVTGSIYAGGLVGETDPGTIINCYTLGNVTGNTFTGGLVGYVSPGTVRNCYSMANVTNLGQTAGGLAGLNDSGTIRNCYSTGSVTGNHSTGGFIGANSGSIINCFSKGSVIGDSPNVGGFVGATGGSYSNCYWDIQTSGQTTSGGGYGRTTQEMTWPHASNCYIGWDFTQIWAEDFFYLLNSGYPHHILQISGIPSPAVEPSPSHSSNTVSINDSLAWQPGFQAPDSNPPTGFYLYLGTDNPPSNMINGLDLGACLSYLPQMPWDNLTTYFWQIVPYNSLGNAVDCPVWSFTTEPYPNPYAVLSETQLSYGNVWIDHIATNSFTISNQGDQNLEVTLLISSGPFTLTTSSGRSPRPEPPRLGERSGKSDRTELSFTVPAVSSETVYVHFLPPAQQDYTRNIFVETNAPNLPTATIPVTGTGYVLFAEFQADPGLGDVPLEVNFTNQSVAGISQSLWDFRDGNTSDETNPVHTFTQEGVYNVQLTVWDDYFNTSVTHLVTVIAHPLLACEQSNGHTYSKTYLEEQSAPFELILQSSGTDTLFVTNVHWKSQNRDSYFQYEFSQLGEAIIPGGEANIQTWFAPLAEGVFADTLCIVNNSENYPLLEIPFSGRGYQLHAGFNYDPPSGDVPLTVNFTDISTEDIIQWDWDFGDGGTASAQNPVYVFQTEGSYQVDLSVSDGIHFDSVSQYVQVIAHPMLACEQSNGHTFTKTYLNELSYPFEVVLQSSGTDTLTVASVHWKSQNRDSYFHYEYEGIGAAIIPGANGTIQVWFAPLAEGVFADTLCIVNNSENQPLLEIPFSGRGYQLHASYDYDPPSGDVPLTVSFSDTSTEDIMQWEWDFGDGFTSTQQNPVHVFETEGTYSVELTVSDGIHFDSAAMSVVVIAHALIGFQDEFSYNFDIVYLGDSSAVISLTLQSTGTDTLFVNNIHWHDSRPEFHYAYGDFSTPILPGHTANIDVWFEPLVYGAFSDTLIIETNAENEPVLKVRFSGRGEYVPPKAPENVYVTINGNHAIIHWDEVTQTIYDTPFNPDCYFVFLAADPYGTFTFLGSSTALSYTHYMVAAYQQYMFYKVIAYKDFGEGRLDPETLGIKPEMTEEEVLRLLSGVSNANH